MKTPICDFIADYCARDPLRLHMPGHKGRGALGCEDRDITELPGADSLYEAEGIIAQSEQNASRLFGCPTFYSTEGASQCIRAMVHMAALWAKQQKRAPLIAAGRNAHRSFLTALALLDVPVRWLWGQEGSYLSCRLTAQSLEEAFRGAQKPTAVYLTSPDYLGHMADIPALARVCRRHGALLLVDNAHGAYLRFLPQSLHPMDLGADLCCSSAHKTLPVLTGGAYLHCSPAFAPGARSALALFGSTSPSYLILQSLDGCNPWLEQLPGLLAACLPGLSRLRQQLQAQGLCPVGDEPLKLTLMPKSCGYTGLQLAEYLQGQGVVCEFADPDHCVLMLSPQTPTDALLQVLSALPGRPAVGSTPPALTPCRAVCTPRQAMLAPSVTVAVEEAVGRVLADPSVGCPPAVPIVLCGEPVTAQALEAFRYYGITRCRVMDI